VAVIGHVAVAEVEELLVMPDRHRLEPIVIVEIGRQAEVPLRVEPVQALLRGLEPSDESFGCGRSTGIGFRCAASE
jgi:hypothetical protein